MTPIQQLYLGVGAKQKTYVDDVFSNYLWAGTGSTAAINNGIDLSSKGGMTWIKNRGTTDNHNLFDTERGVTKYLRSNENTGETTDTGTLSAFNSNGFSVVDGSNANASSNSYSGFSFRKAPGFFDVVTWTGNGAAGSRTISHSLGCVPGCIMIKAYSHNGLNWAVGHRSLNKTGDAWDYMLKLNNDDGEANDAEIFNDTAPTSTNFTIGNSNLTNTNNVSYVAYVFAGGKGTTSRAVEFDGSGDYLTTNSSSDYTLSTGDFTLEYWYKPDTVGYSTFIIDAAGGGEIWSTYCNTSGDHKYRVGGTDRIVSDTSLSFNEWHHIAIVRASGTTKMYVNGVKEGSDYSDSTDYSFTQLVIGRRTSAGDLQYDGKISNLRLVKGRAVYTSNFTPSATQLSGIPNTVLLCCNNSSVTGTTLGTLTASGDPTVTTNDSLFDDLDGFVFGENEDQNVITCGSYLGNGGTQDIELGFEPQWFIVKKVSDSSNWHMVDCMRGCVTGGNDTWFEFDTNSADSTGNFFKVTPTGFSFEATAGSLNGSGHDFIYIAIRRSDGYVGKPIETGTDVFNIIAGGSGSTGGAGGVFTSNFPVDFGTIRTTGSHPWQTGARLMGENYFPGIEQTNATTTASNFSWDSNIGYVNGNFTGYYSWVWRRHAGFDVITYTGDGTARVVKHSLGRAPEMIWVKRRSSSKAWGVYHKGLNGGSSPEDYRIKLNEDGAEAYASVDWNSTAPTSTHFSVGNSSFTNANNDTYMAILFASVAGISSVGLYSGSASTVTVTTGFQPRFLMIKRRNGTGDFHVLDTVRGWSSGSSSKNLRFNSNGAQGTDDFGQPTSTGFELPSQYASVNTNGNEYIYYAHA
tara:strand:- start:34 stop:2598 length:2565 start_codon:yes stop_codon:yes gene_type:complete